MKDALVSNNQQINWVPEHIKNRRFGNWLENARDWSISRNRFWGAPIPVWVSDDGEVVVIGSVEELKQKAINPDSIGDLHRPFIDNVEILTTSGKKAKRITEVFDCWFESGSMPYAQDHYPFENADEWSKCFPATFIAEAIDQTRGWFYTLHVLATLLFDKPAFQNVICSGWIVAADGEKLSKRKKNYAPMDEIFDQFGVDTLRFFMASSPIVNGEDVRFSVDYLRDVQRKVFMTLYNTYSFYKLYADVDHWKLTQPLVEPESSNVLDRWMLSRLNSAIQEVTKAMDDYHLDKATRPISDLLDDISNWFVRRSRRRFWKSEDDADKQQAYSTLNFVLLRLCQLMAPFSPFLTDFIWRELVQGTDLPKSVHLSDWPQTNEINQPLLDQMAQARQYITIGLAQRAEAKIRVRQPLASVVVPKLPDLYKELIAEELNIKSVEWGDGVKINIQVTPELKREGLIRDVVHKIQSARKEAGLDVDDRINLSLVTTDDELEKAINEHTDIIKNEALALELVHQNNVVNGFKQDVLVDNKTLGIAIERINKK
jgi:isoleucyl-tRNA synthetase